MFKKICEEFGVDILRLSRDYYSSPLKRGEKINKEDILYCFIELNLQTIECAKIFNTTYSKVRIDSSFYNIFKSPALQQQNREKNSIEKYGVINPGCREDVKEKRKNTCLEKYGYENSASNPEIKAKTLKTMNARYGGNAPACSKEILEKIKRTNRERYGADWIWETEEGKERQKQAIFEKYGVYYIAKLPETTKKREETCLKKYGRKNIGQFGTPEHKAAIKNKYDVENITQSEQFKEKYKQTVRAKYGVDTVLVLPQNQIKAKKVIREKYGTNCILTLPEFAEKAKQGRAKWRQSPEYPETLKRIIQKAWETRKKNGTTNTSNAEQEILKLLKVKFPNVVYQYKSEEYPFWCDFYIPELKLYIEYQGDWSHGGKYGPFNETDPEHLQVLNKWKEGNNRIAKEKNITGKRNRYSNAIEVWTVRDPLKRKTAKENGLNWIEFFNINQFMDWYSLF